MKLDEFDRYPLLFGPSPVHPLGGLGFAQWAREVERQEEELGQFFDTIVVCTVTGSTHAGMIAGFAAQSRPRRVLGIDASARLEGVILDPVYEGKSMAGLIDLVRSGEIPASSNVLYAHLGDQPALNAYAGIF